MFLTGVCYVEVSGFASIMQISRWSFSLIFFFFFMTSVPHRWHSLPNRLQLSRLYLSSSVRQVCNLNGKTANSQLCWNPHFVVSQTSSVTVLNFTAVKRANRFLAHGKKSPAAAYPPPFPFSAGRGPQGAPSLPKVPDQNFEEEKGKSLGARAAQAPWRTQGEDMVSRSPNLG